MRPKFLSSQRGGALSLLIVLLVIGLAAYFAIHAYTAKQAGPGGEQAMVNCSKAASDLVGRTGGIGPDYKAGYDALPAQCRGYLPPPMQAPAAEPQ
jgi:uncharacterized protein (UPF0333 family)